MIQLVGLLKEALLIRAATVTKKAKTAKRDSASKLTASTRKRKKVSPNNLDTLA